MANHGNNGPLDFLKKKMKGVIQKVIVGLLLPMNCIAAVSMGPQSCRVWVVDRQQQMLLNGTPQMGQASILERAWLAGFVSGIAEASGKDFLKDVDEKTLGFWMDRYCRVNSQKNTMDGGIDFAKELMKQKGLIKL